MPGRALGYDEAGEGPVLLLVHGFPLDRTMWAEQISGLSDISRVVAVDLRGRGKSPEAGDGWTIDDYADDVAATIDSLGVDKVDLAGMSMGGYVVLAAWRRHPDKIRSVILINTKAEADSQEAKEAREKTAIMVREKGTAELINGLFPKMFAPGANDAVKDKVRTMFEDTPSETAAADALVMKDRPDSTSDLGSINVPVLVIQGEEDSIMSVDGSKAMAGNISGARFTTVPSAGHMAPVENPEAVNQAIREFLDGIED